MRSPRIEVKKSCEVGSNSTAPGNANFPEMESDDTECQEIAAE